MFTAQGVADRVAVRRWGLLLTGAVVLLAAVSLLFGSGDIGPGRSLSFLTGGDVAGREHVDTVVTTLRMPRTLLAVLIGSGLGIAGAILQAATRNPIAETGLLGVNSGAALGVVTGITYAGAEVGADYLLWAFLGALAASGIVLLLAGSGRAAMSPLRLILAGAALSATFRGLTAYLTLGNATTFDQYRYWVLGSLSGVSMDLVLGMTPVFIVGMVLAFVIVRPLGALQLGDDAARALGHRPTATRIAVAVAVTLLTAAATALAGPIAFLGLIAPYIARAIAGPALAPQLALSALAGASVMLSSDILARLIVKPYEAPASVLLAVVGGPILVWIVRTNRTVGVGT
jgi:iron complex transport system permease protein